MKSFNSSEEFISKRNGFVAKRPIFGIHGCCVNFERALDLCVFGYRFIFRLIFGYANGR